MKNCFTNGYMQDKFYFTLIRINNGEFIEKF